MTGVLRLGLVPLGSVTRTSLGLRPLAQCVSVVPESWGDSPGQGVLTVGVKNVSSPWTRGRTVSAVPDLYAWSVAGSVFTFWIHVWIDCLFVITLSEFNF